ncbi:MAG TPA: hypothetical protein VM221_11645 [Armatimonadota bacterium]|nr:hypothetical protein [Armatimonadota bacterium]
MLLRNPLAGTARSIGRGALIAWLSASVLPQFGYTAPPAGQSPPAPAGRAERWRQDLHYLATELPQRHQHLFSRISREQFEQAVAALDNSIPALADDEVAFGMMRLVASVADSHTTLDPWSEESFRVFPLRLYWFRDGLYVTRTIPSYRRALGARLTAIGDTPVDQAYAAVSALISHENDAQLKHRSPGLLTAPDALHALHLLPSAKGGRFVFADAHGATFALDLTPISADASTAWIDALAPSTQQPPLHMRNRRAFYWFEYLEDSQTIYVQYNRCMDMRGKPFRDFCAEVLAVVDARPLKRFILDLRYNSGGSSPLAQPLISGLSERPAINRRGALFVVVGRQTFSSAVLNAIDLRNSTRAIFVGEPTGGKPNHYGEVRSFRLPNSGFLVTYSTKYFAHSKQDTPSFMPDLLVEPTFADYQAGRDPLLETILAYREDAR